MRNILFVCHGNICRSPMAEFILKALVKAYGLEDLYYIESAGVSDEEYGNPIYPPAKRCLNQHGVWFGIIYMDYSNRRWLDRIFGGDPEGKVHSMMSYAGKSRDVADPWYTGDFERTFQDILEGCEAMLSGETVSRG